MNTDPVIIETFITAPINKVWEALTKKEKIKEWSFDIPDFVSEEGHEFHFYGGREEKQYFHICKIKDIKQQKKISYTWKYEGYSGESLVTFELFPHNETTKVRLTHEGIETFPADNPDLTRDRFVEGWDNILNKSLKKFAEGKMNN